MKWKNQKIVNNQVVVDQTQKRKGLILKRKWDHQYTIITMISYTNTG